MGCHFQAKKSNKSFYSVAPETRLTLLDRVRLKRDSSQN